MADQPAYARAFNLHLPDGSIRHGALFPSGCHLTEGPNGLEMAATDMPALLESYPGATITWADGGTA